MVQAVSSRRRRVEQPCLDGRPCPFSSISISTRWDQESEDGAENGGRVFSRTMKSKSRSLGKKISFRTIPHSSLNAPPSFAVGGLASVEQGVAGTGTACIGPAKPPIPDGIFPHIRTVVTLVVICRPISPSKGAPPSAVLLNHGGASGRGTERPALGLGGT